MSYNGYNKYLLIIICFFIIGGHPEVQANDITRKYAKLKLDLSTGITLPLGILFSIEPKYALNDQLNIGIKLEGATMSQNIHAKGEGFTGEAFNASTFQLTLDHYWNSSLLRPFIGTGAGLTSVEINDNSKVTVETEESFGLMLRSGFEQKRLKVAIEYNINGYTESHPKNNYLGLKIGYIIGGKRKINSN